jgi:uncharacterized protein (TIGR00725 family)
MAEDQKHQHFKLKIAISGAAETAPCGGDKGMNLAMEMGREVVRQGAILVTGATTGFPFWAARGAKEEGGIVFGLSPAANEREHVEMYKLPLDYTDLIIYTGFGYSGRNLLMTRAADAVLIGCGRIGTLNEFTVAFEDEKPVGVLEADCWETHLTIKNMLEKSTRPYKDKVVFSDSPKELVKKLIEITRPNKQEGYKVYSNGDKFHEECVGPNCKVIL